MSRWSLLRILTSIPGAAVLTWWVSRPAVDMHSLRAGVAAGAVSLTAASSSSLAAAAVRGAASRRQQRRRWQLKSTQFRWRSRKTAAGEAARMSGAAARRSGERSAAAAAGASCDALAGFAAEASREDALECPRWLCRRLQCSTSTARPRRFLRRAAALLSPPPPTTTTAISTPAGAQSGAVAHGTQSPPPAAAAPPSRLTLTS
jgi:hypothetical protein